MLLISRSTSERFPDRQRPVLMRVGEVSEGAIKPGGASKPEMPEALRPKVKEAKALPSLGLKRTLESEKVDPQKYTRESMSR